MSRAAWIILVCGLVTAGIRFLPFLVFGGRRETPTLIVELGRLMPYAAMAMLVVYCLRDVSFAYEGGGYALHHVSLDILPGQMIAFERETVDGKYACKLVLLPLSSVANYEKKIPLEWLNEEGNGLKHEFIDYVLPLIQGEPKLPLECSLPRYARLKKVLAE